MRRLILTALFLLGQTTGLGAQRVPGRDLLQFPLGTIDRAPALGGGMVDGLGNPAAIALPAGERARIGLTAIRTSADQGVAVYLAAAALNLPRRFTAGVSVLRATVNDLYRTDTDPNALGGEIPYGTVLYSAGIARQNGGRVLTGLAVRYRVGETDLERESAFGIDGGILLQHLPFRDANLGAATFLWRPANADEERTSLNLAGDLRVVGSVRRGARAGYALTLTEGDDRDHFAFAAGRYERWEMTVGALFSEAFGSSGWRDRLGIRLHYGEYLVGIAREGGESGLAATYQFTLAMTFRDR
jgi:hypothetical protein